MVLSIPTLDNLVTASSTLLGSTTNIIGDLISSITEAAQGAKLPSIPTKIAPGI